MTELASRTARPVPFERAAPAALADPVTRRNVLKATTSIRARRAQVVGETIDWEELRDAGAAIKERALGRLDELLVQLEASVTAAGGQVHWARDALEANELVTALVAATGEREVVKVKSLTTDEIGLNDALAGGGLTVVETAKARRNCMPVEYVRKGISMKSPRPENSIISSMCLRVCSGV